VPTIARTPVAVKMAACGHVNQPPSMGAAPVLKWSPQSVDGQSRTPGIRNAAATTPATKRASEQATTKRRFHSVTFRF